MNATPFDLDSAIRRVPDFPRPGILFYDITSVLTNPPAFNHCVDSAIERYNHNSIDVIGAIDARGFIFGAPIAYRLRKPLVLFRKNKKLPGPTYQRTFTLEYGEDTIEVQKSDIAKGMRILLVDDLIATGGTLRAAADIVHSVGASVVGIFAIVGLLSFDYRRILSGIEVTTLCQYSSEMPANNSVMSTGR